MALTDESGVNVSMPVAPMGYPGYPVYAGNNNGGFSGDWSWIIILLLFGLFGGNGFGGGFGGNYDFPWILNGQNGINNNVSSGFRDVQLNDNITSVRDGIGNIQTQLCNGFASVNATVNSTAANAETAANARAMANMQQLFGLQSQFADCCCENRLANCQTQNVIQSEGAATRFAEANNTRDILENCNRNNQAILDKLCQLELDGKNDRIADLERQLTMANLSASQIAQTAQIQRGQVAEVDALYQRLRDCPVPTQPVYGSQPIFTCPNNNGCGCGNNF